MVICQKIAESNEMSQAMKKCHRLWYENVKQISPSKSNQGWWMQTKSNTNQNQT